MRFSCARSSSRVRFIIVLHFPVETDDPLRPFLNARGEFENPSLKAMADLFIECMIAHGCDPDVAKNLAYSLFGVVDVLPVLGPPNWQSKISAYISPNDYLPCLKWLKHLQKCWKRCRPSSQISKGISYLEKHTISFESIWGNQSILS